MVMNDNNDPNDKNVKKNLRQEAEKILQSNELELVENIEKMEPESIKRVVHELKVHQIELEMQNDELLKVHTELDVSLNRYFELYDLAPVGYFTLNDKGLVMEANLTASKMLGKPRGELVNRPITSLIMRDD